MHWMNENYGQILDLFRRFDSDNSGKLSYEEFADGMRDLGTYLNLFANPAGFSFFFDICFLYPK